MITRRLSRFEFFARPGSMSLPSLTQRGPHDHNLSSNAPRAFAARALKFAMEQKAVSAETPRKIGVALASARRNLAQLKERGKSKRPLS